MKIGTLVDRLRRPEAYPHGVGTGIQVRQTHISVVFLAGEFAYKVKKPVDLEFLDFTTLDRRRRYCREEVRLNRRLAPGVYLGVVAVTDDGDDGLRVDGEGPPVEYAVKMRRLPDEATLLARLREGRLTATDLEALGTRIAGFHSDAARGPEISRYGRWDVVAGNARENLAQAGEQVGRIVSPAVRHRLHRALERSLRHHRPLVEERAERDVPRDTHGDLHLEHVYHLPDRNPPDDLVVIDCIEFNERFRFADPVSDMAFLAMDLLFRGRPDLERAFVDAYFRRADDPDGRRLLPFYRSYRSAVRGKVEGMLSGDPDVPEREREKARQRARGHWLLALSELEPPGERPALVLVGGLPGTGKSTVAGRIAEEAKFRVISSDRVRKELAGRGPDETVEARFEEGLYAPEWTRRTYRACLERAKEGILRGDRILVDASFRHEDDRLRFLDAGRDLGVRTVLLWCEAPDGVVRERLARRDSGPSDADWEIHRRVAERWDEPGERTSRSSASVSTGDSVDASLRRALERLRERGLVDEADDQPR